MVNRERVNFSGAMRNTSTETNSNNSTNSHCNINESNNNQPLPSSSTASSYLIFSPSNPVRIFAISFLTHWIYPTVSIVTICAFVISSVYYNYGCSGHSFNETLFAQEKQKEIVWKSAVEYTRWILFTTILLEIFLKSIARGLLVGSQLAYLRILWDWLDIASLVLIFVSIFKPWKAVELTAAAGVLLKLIPIHPGSINAFIFLCSCAKKIIPVLVYGLIIVWIYGVVIFTLFIKYQQPHEHEELFPRDYNDPANGGSGRFSGASNASTSDNDENTSITRHPLSLVDESSYHASSSAEEKSQNFSFGLSMECLPTNFRSLSGSFIQTVQMLSLRHNTQSAEGIDSGTNASSLNTAEETSCQHETYTLSIIETLVIITGTLPMISMTFAVLYNFFQVSTATAAANSRQQSSHQNQADGDEYQCGQSSRGHDNNGHNSTSNSSQQNNNNNEKPPCFHSAYNQLANALCDCDYYFCCLANLQRKLSPYSSRILNSTKFKVFVLFVLSTDFVCMITLLWFSNSTTFTNIDFPLIWRIAAYCIQICFILYTVEVVFRLTVVESDEYWSKVWPAFDLLLVLLYWLGYIVMYVRSCPEYYPQLCAILMIRMLKVVPFWKSLEQTLQLLVFSVLANRHNLFVILICSCNSILVKCAAYMLETQRTEKLSPKNLTEPLPLVESGFLVILHLLFSVIIIATFTKVYDSLRTSREVTPPNPTISFLLNHHQDESNRFDELNTDLLHVGPRPRLSVNDGSPINLMPMSNGISYSSSKYTLASSPCDSNSGALLSQDTHSSFLSPRTSDVLSPLLPIPNGLNGYVHHFPRTDDTNSHEEIVRLRIRNAQRQTSNCFYLCATPQDITDLTTVVVIILASLNLVLGSSDDEMNWRKVYPGKSLWVEVFFILCIGVHIVYKVRLQRFPRDSFLQISSIIDLIIILCTAVEVFSSGMKWVPPLKTGLESRNIFLECAKILSASRGLLFFSRISWLQCVSSGLCYATWKLAKYLAAFGYVWIAFLISFIEAQKMIMTIVEDCGTGSGNPFVDSNNFTNLSSRDFSTKTDFETHPVLLTITILLMLLTLGVFLAYLCNLGDFDKIMEMFITKNQEVVRRNRASPIGSDFGEPPPEQPTEGTCVPILYFVTNHRTFDIIVMTVILLDGLGITLEYFATSDRALVLRKHYPAYMIFLYGMELCCKLIGNGYQFFKSYWNIFDCVTVAISFTDFCVSLAYPNWIPALTQTVRFFRILRIFQFQPFCRHTKIIHSFFMSLSGIVFHIWNYIVLYFFMYLAVLIYRMRYATPAFLHHLSVPEVIAAPFQKLDVREMLGELGNANLASLNANSILFTCGLLFLSAIRISVIFSLCFILISTLCQHLTQECVQTINVQEFNNSRRTTFDVQHDDPYNNDDDHVDIEDKSSYMMPCITPDTIDIETSSSAGTSSRLISNNARCTDSAGDTERGTTSLYKTTTITSSEEINGCKVFFVEAMITTV